MKRAAGLQWPEMQPACGGSMSYDLFDLGHRRRGPRRAGVGGGGVPLARKELEKWHFFIVSIRLILT